MSWLSNFFLGEFEGKVLQKSGDLTKDQLMQFFQHGNDLFSNLEFKKALHNAYMLGTPAQELVDQTQAKIWEEKVTPAVQGDYGLYQLQYVLSRFQNDPEFCAQFYQFVHLEEKTLDEAEMDPEDYQMKYRQLERLQLEMQNKLKEKEEELQGMDPQQKQQYLAAMYQRMVTESLSMAPPLTTAPQQPDAAPVVEPGPSGLRDDAVPDLIPMAPAAAMNPNEQLAFFSSMARAPGQQQ